MPLTPILAVLPRMPEIPFIFGIPGIFWGLVSFGGSLWAGVFVLVTFFLFSVVLPSFFASKLVFVEVCQEKPPRWCKLFFWFSFGSAHSRSPVAEAKDLRQATTSPRCTAWPGFFCAMCGNGLHEGPEAQSRLFADLITKLFRLGISCPRFWLTGMMCFKMWPDCLRFRAVTKSGIQLLDSK